MIKTRQKLLSSSDVIYFKNLLKFYNLSICRFCEDNSVQVGEAFLQLHSSLAQIAVEVGEEEDIIRKHSDMKERRQKNTDMFHALNCVFMA